MNFCLYMMKEERNSMLGCAVSVLLDILIRVVKGGLLIDGLQYFDSWTMVVNLRESAQLRDSRPWWLTLGM